MNLKDVKEGIRLGQKAKRVGRGAGSGHGKTSGKGHKGLNARAGNNMGPTYEGGQTPLFQRIAKRGFSNARFKTVYSVVNVSALESFENGDVVGAEELQAKGWVDNLKDGLKILGFGELSKKLTVKAQSFSKSAQASIEAAGGTCEVVSTKDA
ncbi:MAG: 50S ribosomal protein L15 [Planctomycetes bacterium]|nr:50S ribosomal protein L15 [Planctomycetota bacterium]